ncbi:MAG: hypothetical protein GZ094_05295 [Mariniphaga sp.]|nr:hypothetical protein [Mariniphaga sp.]
MLERLKAVPSHWMLLGSNVEGRPDILLTVHPAINDQTSATYRQAS